MLGEMKVFSHSTYAIMLMLIKKANHCDSSEKSSSGHLIYCRNSLLNFKRIQFQDNQGCAQTNMSYAKQNNASNLTYCMRIQPMYEDIHAIYCM